MVALILVPGLLAAPFWESRPAAQWSDEEIQTLLRDSPWAQAAMAPMSTDGVPAYLATARPIQEAERELLRRNPVEDPNAEEYREFLRENQGKVIVLAVFLPRPDVLLDPVEAKRMEEECLLKVGRKKHKMIGHFPPAPSDPYLRLVYPRAVSATDNAFSFELYLPGVPAPYRTVEFRVKDLTCKGALEM
jgi:hypothetical protein